jgi:hypothetical protein
MSNEEKLLSTKITTSLTCIDNKTTYRRCRHISIIEDEGGINVWDGCLGGKYLKSYKDLIDELKDEFDVIIQTGRTVSTHIKQNINL